MSYNNGWVSCEIVQRNLREDWEDPSKWLGTAEMMPHVAFLSSDMNTKAWAREMTGNGTKRQVRFVYSQQLLRSAVQRNVAIDTCQAETKRYDNETVYDIDLDVNLSVAEGYSLKELTEVCDAAAKERQIIQRLVDVLGKEVAQEVAIASVGQTGGWNKTLPNAASPGFGNNVAGYVNGANQLQWKYRYADGKVDPESLAILQNAIQDSGMPRNIPAFGGTNGRAAAQAFNIGCCNDSGLNIAEALAQFGFSYSYDPYVQAAFATNGANEFMVIKPGVQQILNYSWAELAIKAGWMDQLGSDFRLDVIVDPRTGQKYDLMRYKTCSGLTMNYRLTWTGTVVALPTDLFPVGDPLNGVRGSAQVLITNP